MITITTIILLMMMIMMMIMIMIVVLLYDLECSFMVKGVQPSICSCRTHDRE